jgi:tRNA-binding EMAP/Myf-like protein
VPLEAMQGRPVIVLCNLKPRNMRGIKSNGMLLAASNAEHTEVEPLVPAQGAAPGSRVWFGQHAEQVGVRGIGDQKQIGATLNEEAAANLLLGKPMALECAVYALPPLEAAVALC